MRRNNCWHARQQLADGTLTRTGDGENRAEGSTDTPDEAHVCQPQRRWGGVVETNRINVVWLARENHTVVVKGQHIVIAGGGRWGAMWNELSSLEAGCNEPSQWQHTDSAVHICATWGTFSALQRASMPCQAPGKEVEVGS